MMARSCRHDQPGKSHVVCLRSTGVLPVVVGDGKLEGGREGREGGRGAETEIPIIHLS